MTSFFDGIENAREDYKETKRIARVVRPPKPKNAYATAALKKASGDVLNASEGERNQQLFKSAAWLGSIVAADMLEEDEARLLLTESALSIGLNANEVEATIRSGFDAGAQNPLELDDWEPDSDLFYDKLKRHLYTSEMMDTVPEPEPLIDGVVSKDSLAYLIGPPKQGKSFVALSIAGAVSSGTPWFGHSTKQGRVLYIAAEGWRGVRSRLRAWETTNGGRMSRTLFLGMAVQASNESHWSDLIRLSTDEVKPDLIIIDTQHRSSNGLKENDETDMGLWVTRVDNLRKATGATVLVVHHTRKLSEDANGRLTMNDLRGSGAIAGAADTIVGCVKKEDFVSVQCLAQKDMEEFDDLDLQALRVDLGSDRNSLVLIERDPNAVPEVDHKAVMKAMAYWDRVHGRTDVSMSMARESASLSLDELAWLVEEGYLNLKSNGTRKVYTRSMKPLED